MIAGFKGKKGSNIPCQVVEPTAPGLARGHPGPTTTRTSPHPVRHQIADHAGIGQRRGVAKV